MKTRKGLAYLSFVALLIFIGISIYLESAKVLMADIEELYVLLFVFLLWFIVSALIKIGIIFTKESKYLYDFAFGLFLISLFFAVFYTSFGFFKQVSIHHITFISGLILILIWAGVDYWFYKGLYSTNELPINNFNLN